MSVVKKTNTQSHLLIKKSQNETIPIHFIKLLSLFQWDVFFPSAAQPQMYEQQMESKPKEFESPNSCDTLPQTDSNVMPSPVVDKKSSVKKRPLHMMPKQSIGQSQRYKCPRCGKDYSQRKNMRRHYRLECGQEPKYACLHPGCSLRFKRHNQMSGHMLTRHGIKDVATKVLLPDSEAFEIWLKTSVNWLNKTNPVLYQCWNWT